LEGLSQLSFSASTRHGATKKTSGSKGVNRRSFETDVPDEIFTRAEFRGSDTQSEVEKVSIILHQRLLGVARRVRHPGWVQPLVPSRHRSRDPLRRCAFTRLSHSEQTTPRSCGAAGQLRHDKRGLDGSGATQNDQLQVLRSRTTRFKRWLVRVKGVRLCLGR